MKSFSFWSLQQLNYFQYGKFWKQSAQIISSTFANARRTESTKTTEYTTNAKLNDLFPEINHQLILCTNYKEEMRTNGTECLFSLMFNSNIHLVFCNLFLLAYVNILSKNVRSIFNQKIFVVSQFLTNASDIF